MRSLLIILFAIGCARDHSVQLLLGPTPDAVTLGFRCRQNAPPNDFLMARAVQNGVLRFSLVVDVIGFGGRFPGCRGEELVTACMNPASCPILRRPNGAKRFCKPVEIPVGLFTDLPALFNTLHDQLNGELVLDDAPNQPVLIRAVATTQPCGAIDEPLGDTYPDLDAGLAVGCAYSCPTQLDEVQGTLALSTDALDDICETGVLICASFPRPY